jgi:hypothetical protein
MSQGSLSYFLTIATDSPLAGWNMKVCPLVYVQNKLNVATPAVRRDGDASCSVCMQMQQMNKEATRC